MLVKCELLIVYNVNGLMFIWLIKGFVYILVFDENEGRIWAWLFFYISR
jgi:hypothetical protein